MIEQRSPEWYKQRLGKFTASRMKDLMARGKANGAPLKAAKDYIEQVLAERLTNEVEITPTTHAMQRGTELEPEAVANYGFATNQTVNDAEFTTHSDYPMIGASPDGLIGTDGLIEVKCPASITNHLSYLREQSHAETYQWQVQTQLLVTGRKWCDLVSYHPSFEPKLQLAIVRIEPSEEHHAAIKRAVLDAEAQIRKALEEIKQLEAA